MTFCVEDFLLLASLTYFNPFFFPSPLLSQDSAYQQLSNVGKAHVFHSPGYATTKPTASMALTKKTVKKPDNVAVNSLNAGKRNAPLLFKWIDFVWEFDDDRENNLSLLVISRRRCIPREWMCDHDQDCGSFDTSDEDESLCHMKEKCLPNQSECASPSGTGPVCIYTEKFCDGTFDCVNDEYTEYCGKWNLSIFGREIWDLLFARGKLFSFWWCHFF